MDPWTNVLPDGTFSLNPPLKSSRTMTSWPALTRCSATCAPMNPAPPVTRLRGLLLIDLIDQILIVSAFCGGIRRRRGQCLSHGWKSKVRFLAEFRESNGINAIVPFHLNRVRFGDGLVCFVRLEQGNETRGDPTAEHQHENWVAHSGG